MVGVALASHIANVYIVGAARDAWLCGYTANLGSILFTLSVALLVVEQNLLPKTMCPLPCFFIQAYNVSAYLVCRFPVRGNEGKERKECQGTSQGTASCISNVKFPVKKFGVLICAPQKHALCTENFFRCSVYRNTHKLPCTWISKLKSVCFFGHDRVVPVQESSSLDRHHKLEKRLKVMRNHY